MFNYLKTGGIFMKMNELVLTCYYSGGETSAAQIIQSSFGAFLKKEFQNIASCLHSAV